MFSRPTTPVPRLPPTPPRTTPEPSSLPQRAVCQRPPGPKLHQHPLSDSIHPFHLSSTTPPGRRASNSGGSRSNRNRRPERCELHSGVVDCTAAQAPPKRDANCIGKSERGAANRSTIASQQKRHPRGESAHGCARRPLPPKTQRTYHCLANSVLLRPSRWACSCRANKRGSRRWC